MATFPFELVAPERLIVSGEAESAQLPGAEGDFEVLEGHAPMLALLGPGIMEVKGGEVGTRRIFIDGGFCDVNNAGCTVLAESATPVDGEAAAEVDRLIAEAEEAVAAMEAGDERDETNRRIAILKTVRAGL
jgi:F-type H+-transporting ATPase subunit epsilon